MLNLKRVQRVGWVILSIAATILVVKHGFLGSSEDDPQKRSLRDNPFLSLFKSAPEVLTTHWTCWNPQAPEKFARLRFVKDSDAHTGLIWFADPNGEETTQGTLVMKSDLSPTVTKTLYEQPINRQDLAYPRSAQINSKQAQLEVFTREQEKILITVDQKSLHSQAKQGQVVLHFVKLKGPSRSQALENQTYECRKFSEVRNLPAFYSDTQVAKF
jgi:hypothetical protein